MSNITNEEILDFLEKIEEDYKNKKIRKIKSKDSSSVKRFVKDKNINIGLDKIPTYVIFYTYSTQWTDSTYRQKKVNKIVFFRAFNKCFIQTRTGKQRYYLLNKESFDLSREGLLKAKKFEERYNEKKEKR
jgi:hypothetical protein